MGYCVTIFVLYKICICNIDTHINRKDRESTKKLENINGKKVTKQNKNKLIEKIIQKD